MPRTAKRGKLERALEGSVRWAAWLTLTVGCFAPPLDYQNRECTFDEGCPSPYTCVVGNQDAGLCDLFPCINQNIGEECLAGSGACVGVGLLQCNAPPGGSVVSDKVVSCSAVPHLADGGACLPDGGT